jgi:phosphoribosylamine--glycine ligase
MGAYTPLPWAPKNLVNEVTQNVLQPMVDQMAKRKTPFVGLLYAGLVLTKSGIKVIEFNVRFGDPETQVVLARLDSALSELLLAAADGKLAQLPELNWKTESAVTVVMAAEGYPEKPVLGASISGLEDASSQGAKVFHAGTALDHTGNVVVNGGRVLSITGVGIDLADARRRAYQAVETIKFAGEHHRTDIALAAVKEEIQIP